MRNSGWLGAWTPVVGLFALVVSANAANAQFEIEKPEVEQGEVELEYQGDYRWGHPNRRFIIEDQGGPDEEIVADENDVARQRHVFGMGMGLTDFFKLTVEVEFEEERFDEIDDVALLNAFGELKATELQFEGVLVLKQSKGDGLGAGAFISLAHPFEGEESELFYVGPILQYSQGPWSVTANPFFVKHFGVETEEDENSDDRWDFEYAWQVAYATNSQVTLAVEGFGTVNRLGESGSKNEAIELFGDQDHHRAGPVIYYTFKGPQGPMKAGKDDDDDDAGGSVTMGVGVLFGLNDDTEDTSLKWSLEAEF